MRLRGLGRRPALTPRGRARRRAAEEEVRALPSRPLISVVMPAYETEAKYLREAIESVFTQRYPDWELCIADDCSPSDSVRPIVDRYRAADPRVKFTRLERNGGISAATNAALELATGEFVAFLDHDDVLPSDALLRVAQTLGERPQLDVVYSDSDKLTLHGTRADPFFKPDWSPTYALGAMYIGHLLVVRRTIAERAGGFDSRFDKIQDFEFMMRVSELTDRIHHVPLILYHWRAIPGSIAAGTDQKEGVEELQAQAVTDHLERLGAQAIAVPNQIPHRAQLAWAVDDAAPAAGPVSAVIAWRGERHQLERSIASLREQDQPPDEIVVVGSEDPGIDGVRFVEDPQLPPSPARQENLGAAAATGEWILFCSDAAEAREPDSIQQMLLHASLPGVAAAGPMLLRPDGVSESAGYAIGLDHPAVPMLPGLDRNSDGYYGSLVCSRDVSAISSDFMLIRRADFETAGGFDENYATGYHDFDLCQRLLASGERVVYAARPRVVMHETAAARLEAFDVVDRALFVDRWYDELLAGDPYFNPNFASDAAAFTPR